MSDLSDNVRRNLIEHLELLSDAERQIEYQKNVSWINVVPELFCQWGDSYIPDSPATAEAFTVQEREALAAFNQAFETISAALPNELPQLEAFMRTDDWQRLRDAARRTLGLLG
jgi:hypothetical protein